MILEGASIQGLSHKEYGVCNQDALRYGRFQDYTIAIVADGVSLKTDHTFSNSEIASRFCAGYVFGYLKEHLDKNQPFAAVPSVLYECFRQTDAALRAFLHAQTIPFWDCQTTLLVVVLYKGRCACGLAGDGGIVFEKRDGKYFLVVTREKTSSLVAPICMEEEWAFSLYEDVNNPICSFIMATDGVFDNLAGFQDGKPVLNEILLHELQAISKVHRKQRHNYLRKVLETIPSSDDKTAIVYMNPKEKKRI